MFSLVRGSATRKAVFLSVVLAFLGLLGASGGCEPRVHPGQTLGTFQVVGSLDANGCGAAVPALDPIAFEVEVRDDRGRGIWVRGDGPIQTGVQLPDGAYRFRTGATVPVISAQPGYRGCNLQQVEMIEVHVTPTTSIALAGEDGGLQPDAGTADADAGADGGVPERAMELSGISEIQYTPTSTSDCSPLPVVNGGPWAALPCTLRYTLFGTGTGPMPEDDAGASAL